MRKLFNKENLLKWDYLNPQCPRGILVEGLAIFLAVFWITVTLGQGRKKGDGKLTCPTLEGAHLIVTNNSGKQRGLRMAYGCGKITPCPVPRSLKGLG